MAEPKKGASPRDERLRLFALGARSPTDTRGPWVYVTSLRSAGPQRLWHQETLRGMSARYRNTRWN